MSSLAPLMIASCLLGQVPEKAPAYSDAIIDIHSDLKVSDPQQRVNFRYFLLHNLIGKEKDDAIDVMMGHPHFLSRSAVIEENRPVLTENKLAMRVDYTNYLWKLNVWESQSDPYTTLPVIVQEQVLKHWPAGKVWPGDKAYSYSFPYKEWVNVRKVQALAPWLVDAEDVKTLEFRKKILDEIVQWTGNSQVPFVRADWFFNQTSASENRQQGYNTFLGFTDEKSFHKVVGFDEKLAKSFKVELRESVAISGVTRQPRAIARYESQGGGLWKSIDFIEIKDKKDPLLVLGRDIEKVYDATEQFAFLPNGFWAVGAFDGKGVYQPIVPTTIAGDNLSKSTDVNIHNGISCFRCHYKGGLKDITEEYVRNTVKPPVNFQPADYDEEKAKELREAYLQNLKIKIKQDRERFSDAVRAATGLESEVFLKKYAWFWEYYEDRKVDAAYAAHDLGMQMSRVEFIRKLKTYQKTYYNAPAEQRLHPDLAALMNGNHLPIHRWEGIYYIAQQTMKAVK